VPSEVVELALPLAAGALAAVFVVSGTAKLRRPYGAALTLRRFGITRRLRPAAGRAVGAAELLAAGAMAVRPECWLGYLPVAVLLAAFTALIARAVAQGERFPCHCFGDHGGDLSAWSLARTGGLFTLAMVATVVAWSTKGAGLGIESRIADECAGVCLAATAFLTATLHQTAPFSSKLTTADEPAEALDA
jgi:hypothetical protein